MSTVLVVSVVHTPRVTVPGGHTDGVFVSAKKMALLGRVGELGWFGGSTG